MEHFIITKEMIKNAKTYMPLANKEIIAKTIASKCIEPAKIDEQNKIGRTFLALPQLKKENIVLKQILFLNVFLGFYFNVDIPEKTKSGEDYNPYDRHDFYAGGDIYNQVDRFKTDLEVKNIVFSLMSDFRDFKKIVESEIYNLKTIANDSLDRFVDAIAVLGNPENIKSLIEEIKKLDIPNIENNVNS